MAEEEREFTFWAFSPYGLPLDMVISFRYLGWLILVAENDWTEVVSNVSWERALWNRMTRILIREGAEPWVSGFLFKFIVQAVLLFGSETWVVTPLMGRALGEFQDQVAQRLTGRLSRRKMAGSRSTPKWRRQGRRWGSRRCRSTFRDDRTRLHSTSLHDQG